MSNSVKMIVGVVAAVVMPYAAPAIAASIAGGAAGSMLAAGAAAIGSTATSALVGAGLGAATSAATGQDIGRGALFGGLGGGLGSLAKTAGAASAAKAGTVGQQYSAATNAAGLATDAAAGLAPAGFTGGAIDATAAGLSSGLTSTAPAAAELGTSAASLAQGAQAGLTNGGAQTLAKPGFVDSLKTGVKDAWTNATSPENVSEFATQGAKYAVGALAAGDGMNSAQEAMLREQRQMARNATQANEAMFNTRRDEALKLVREADYFDPEYMGLQRARDAQLRGARSKTAGLRGLDAGSRTAEARRYDLNNTRNTGTAYDQGYQSGVTARNQTRTAGLSQLPTSYQTNMSDYTGVGTAYDEADKRRRQMSEDIGNLFGDFSGSKNAKSVGG